MLRSHSKDRLTRVPSQTNSQYQSLKSKCELSTQSKTQEIDNFIVDLRNIVEKYEKSKQNRVPMENDGTMVGHQKKMETSIR